MIRDIQLADTAGLPTLTKPCVPLLLCLLRSLVYIIYNIYATATSLSARIAI
jgi:hypothetical protein